MQKPTIPDVNDAVGQPGEILGMGDDEHGALLPDLAKETQAPSGRALRGERVERDSVGGAAPERRGRPAEAAGRRRLSHKTEARADLIHAALKEVPDITLPELKARLARQGAEVSVTTLWRFCRRHELTRKKKTAHAVEQDRSDILKRREAWFEGQLDLDPRRLVFIDETWASTNMARRYGRAPRGQRLRLGVPHGHWKTTTFVAGLRASGLVALFVLDGRMKTVEPALAAEIEGRLSRAAEAGWPAKPLSVAQASCRAGVRADKTGQRLPAVPLTRHRSGSSRVGHGLHSSQPPQARKSRSVTPPNVPAPDSYPVSQP